MAKCLFEGDVMRNRYEIINDVVVIIIKSKRFGMQIAYVDVSDLEKLNELDVTWSVRKRTENAHYYAFTNIRVDGRRTSLSMHRFLTNCPDGYVVDHINGNGLNNIKSNLRVVTQAQNIQNRKSANSNSTTGIRGVTYHKGTNKYIAEVRLKGKRVFHKYFNTIEEAEKAVKLARKQHLEYTIN